jgi:hypothetical protein
MPPLLGNACGGKSLCPQAFDARKCEWGTMASEDSQEMTTGVAIKHP